jgi:hypothetical protein
MTPDINGALRFFALASDYVRCAGFLAEIEWQRARSISEFSETEFLRESAWVVLCSGFRESVVRSIFNLCLPVLLRLGISLVYSQGQYCVHKSSYGIVSESLEIKRYCYNRTPHRSDGVLYVQTRSVA